MKDQIRLANTLDLSIILGGEGKKPEEKTRSNHAHEIYKKLERKDQLNYILTGYKSALNERYVIIPESIDMFNYLTSLNMPKEIFHIETKSRDTLGNIIFSQPIIEQICSGTTKKRIGIITDKYHVERSLWVANTVLGKKYEIFPLPTQKDASIMIKIQEKIILNMWKYDFSKQKIEPGNKEAFEEYMKTKHPIHAKNPPSSTYKTGLELYKLINKKFLNKYK